jgi:LPS export ABC transporter protein LptC
MSPRRIAKFLALSGIVALTVILAVSVAVVRKRSTRQRLQTVAAIVPGALLHAHNFHWTQMHGGRSQWVLKAQDASYANDKASIILDQPRLSMTAQDGKKVLLRAASAKLGISGNHINRADLSGGLTVDYGDFVLATDQATFLPDADQLQAPGLVHITGPGLHVTGIGLTGHPKEQTFSLLKQVTTQIDPKRQGSGERPHQS